MDEFYHSVVVETISNEDSDSSADAKELIMYNSDGSIRQRNRLDYSRGPKRLQLGNPLEFCVWLRD